MSLEANYESVKGQLDALRAALADGTASDGYHTHNELYHYRMLYNAHTALAFDHAGWNVVRSRKHSDGEACFGGGWFVLHMETPAGQITNHYQDEHWHHFDGIAEAPTAPDWDGHTPEVAALRLEAAIEFLRRQFEQMRNHADLMKRVVARVLMADRANDVRACNGCGKCSYCKQFPRGLCGNRADHAPHLHDSAGLGRFWCDADQSKRLPFAMERKGGGK